MTLTTILIACLGSSGLASVIVAILNRRWAKKDQKDERLDAVVDGLKVLTVDRVRYLGKSYLNDQEILLEDKENLQEMYRAYKALGGNGHLETIMSEIEKLPIVTEDETHI